MSWCGGGVVVVVMVSGQGVSGQVGRWAGGQCTHCDLCLAAAKIVPIQQMTVYCNCLSHLACLPSSFAPPIRDSVLILPPSQFRGRHSLTCKILYIACYRRTSAVKLSFGPLCLHPL